MNEKKDMQKKTAKAASSAGRKREGFTAEEQAAMKERSRELKKSARGQEGEADVLARIAGMPEPDRGMAQRLHAIIKDIAPSLAPRTWYGMPAYATNGEVVCFFQPAQKFKTRYSTLGFSDKAHLDDGSMWPTAFALDVWNAEVEARVVALVKKAAG